VAEAVNATASGAVPMEGEAEAAQMMAQGSVTATDPLRAQVFPSAVAVRVQP